MSQLGLTANSLWILGGHLCDILMCYLIHQCSTSIFYISQLLYYSKLVGRQLSAAVQVEGAKSSCLVWVSFVEAVVFVVLCVFERCGWLGSLFVWRDHLGAALS